MVQAWIDGQATSTPPARVTRSHPNFAQRLSLLCLCVSVSVSPVWPVCLGSLGSSTHRQTRSWRLHRENEACIHIRTRSTPILLVMWVLTASLVEASMNLCTAIIRLPSVQSWEPIFLLCQLLSPLALPTVVSLVHNVCTHVCIVWRISALFTITTQYSIHSAHPWIDRLFSHSSSVLFRWTKKRRAPYLKRRRLQRPRCGQFAFEAEV